MKPPATKPAAQGIEGDTLILRVRLPNALHKKYGKYLIIPKITFAYGHQEIKNALS